MEFTLRIIYVDFISVFIRIMDGLTNNASNSSPISRLIPVLIFTAGLIALYFLYQYLFGPKTGQSYPLITKSQPAMISDPTKAPYFASDKLPLLYEGGEFTVTTWIYINDWKYRNGYNKSIMILGGTTDDILRIYLGGNKPKLYVRFHTYEAVIPAGNPPSSTPPSSTPPSSTPPSSTPPSTPIQSDNLSVATRTSTFENQVIEGGLLESSDICDLPEIPLQRWVNITVAANGKTVDVYLDGKLSRSCILPRPFKVPATYGATLLGFGGFGGQLSTTTIYDAALNPEQVYKNYMAGPEPVTSIGDWFSATFLPGVNISVTTQ
jgi:hypothetical protein